MSFRACVIALSLLIAGGAWAAPEAGKDYRLLQAPQPGSSPGKIEVLEFFSYGCPHCYTMHPLITQWSRGLPADVAFKRVPVSFGRPAWVSLARAYLAFDSTGDLKKYDGALFDAIHSQQLPLTTEQAIADWVGKQGGDPAKFLDTMNSFGVNARLSQSDQMVKSYQVDGVPRIVVDGRYVAMGQTYEDMLKVAGQLVDKARAEKKTAALPARKQPS